jgi:CRISPR-associated protein Cmr4
MNARLTFVHALSPLHAGTGQGVGVIDLPIAREKATGLPFLPGSSLKGPLRSLCPIAERTQVFGPESTSIPGGENQASPAQFSDQRLLLLPIRSLAGTFAWVTSPYILQRFVRDMKEVLGNIQLPSVPSITNEQCAVAKDVSKITIGTPQKTVYLEDLDLPVQADQDMTTWATWIGKQVFPDDETWQAMLIERFCIVPDDIFNFLIETATEITARIKLLEGSKTVQDGGLWYEEALPAETILSGIVLVNPMPSTKITETEIFKILQSLTTGKAVQFGGKATVGRGMCRVLIGKEGK